MALNDDKRSIPSFAKSERNTFDSDNPSNYCVAVRKNASKDSVVEYKTEIIESNRCGLPQNEKDEKLKKNQEDEYQTQIPISGSNATKQVIDEHQYYFGNNGSVACVAQPPIPNGYWGQMAYDQEYSKLTARYNFSQLQDTITEKIESTPSGVKHVKTDINGKETAVTILKNRYIVAGVISIVDDIFIRMSILNISTGQMIITRYFSDQILKSNAEMEKLLVEYFDIVDFHVFSKNSLASIRNNISNCKRYAPMLKLENIGFFETSDGKYTFGLPNDVADNLDNFFVQNTRMPVNEKESLDVICSSLKMMLNRNAGFIKELSFLIMFGITANIRRFIQNMGPAPSVNLVGNSNSYTKVVNNILTLLGDKDGDAWIYDLQEFNVCNVSEILGISVDDVLPLDVTNRRRKGDLFKLICGGRSVGKCKVRSFLALCMEYLLCERQSGYYFQADTLHITSEDGKALEGLKRYLIEEISRKPLMIVKMKEWKDKESATSLEAVALVIDNFGAAIWGEEVTKIVSIILKAAKQYREDVTEYVRYPEVQLFIQMLKYKVFIGSLKIVDQEKIENTEDLDDQIIRKDDFLYFNTRVFNEICEDGLITQKSSVTELKKSLKRTKLIKTYSEEYKIDLSLSGLKKPLSMFAIKADVLNDLQSAT